jgi:DNA replication protein DnaC
LWGEIMGTERMSGALLDRLTHRGHIIEANGPSYRLRESKKRLRKRGEQTGKDDEASEG